MRSCGWSSSQLWMRGSPTNKFFSSARCYSFHGLVVPITASQIFQISNSSSTNGLAEKFVQTFKKSIKAMEREDMSRQHKVDSFLIYRNSVHATTNQTPAMLFMNRSLRSCIDLLKLNLQSQVQNKQFSHLPTKAARDFGVGQEILACDYRGDCGHLVG